jgi:hypothetical protein
MSDWTLLLCEGPHNQVFLGELLRVCAGWNPIVGVPNTLPEFQRVLFPKPKQSVKAGAWELEHMPTALEKSARKMFLRNLKG